MNSDYVLSRKVREKLITWKAKAVSIGRWCRRKNFLKRNGSGAKAAFAPIDSSLTQGDKSKLENQCGIMFHPFSRLPLELRLEIWRMSWDSRNVGIVTKFDYSRDSDGTLQVGITELKTCISPPSTMSVNRESRVEALLHYKLLALGPLSYGHVVSEFYFNHELDTIAIYIVSVNQTSGYTYHTFAGLVHHFLDTVTALRDIRSLIMIPMGRNDYYVVSLGDHEIYTNHQSAWSYLSELLLLADSCLKGVIYDASYYSNDLIPIGYSPISLSHPSPLGYLIVIPELLGIPEHGQDTKVSYGFFCFCHS
ncbi:hypothetical protein BOTCAL_0066g00240 [Botryotinia calthae]|uniref:2EXR domain-containing protein n=1 Tax=Botryotinia calthae TaxID=38488 RepID=A0A4Y8D9D3_9HELO|nr:hypothetical protein BOTCAL_0066g00240 [Botryotinia calthae]